MIWKTSTWKFFSIFSGWSLCCAVDVVEEAYANFRKERKERERAPSLNKFSKWFTYLFYFFLSFCTAFLSPETPFSIVHLLIHIPIHLFRINALADCCLMMMMTSIGLKSWPPQFRDRYHPMQCVFVVRRFLALFGCVWRADAYPRLVQRIKQVIIIKYNKNRKNILWQ